ncbi:hypothetical protein D9M68_957250 [compost metagenome]
MRSAAPTCVKVACWPSTDDALRSAASMRGSRLSSASPYSGPSGSIAMLLSPCLRPRTLVASTLALSRTSGKADGLPTSACDTLLARRCDCMRA